MYHIMDEAGEVAGARWFKTETRAQRLDRLAAPLLAQAGAIVDRRWAETQPTAITSKDLPPDKSISYRIFDSRDSIIRCHLCGHDDHWTVETDKQGVILMFVCEHEPLRIGQGLIRQVSTAALSRVVRFEEVTNPDK